MKKLMTLAIVLSVLLKFAAIRVTWADPWTVVAKTMATAPSTPLTCVTWARPGFLNSGAWFLCN